MAGVSGAGGRLGRFGGGRRLRWPRRLGWLETGFIIVVALALGMRLWELGGRTMHYDEAIHLQYAWRLARSSGGLLGWPWFFGDNYTHSAWMHGPFQIELTAAFFRIFGDNDFIARLPYALFGAGLVGLPYLMRRQLGRAGALLAAVMLALSPALLYFSRFGRNDIIMVFLASALLLLLWRYMEERRRVYLYLIAAALALMFASKETAYLVVALFGLLLFLLSWPDLRTLLRERAMPPVAGRPIALLVLLATLTLPQWSAAVGLLQGPLGLTLANPDKNTEAHIPNFDGSDGLTGAPAWAGPVMPLPLAELPLVLHAAVGIAAVALLLLLSPRPFGWRNLLGGLASPVGAGAAVAVLLLRPLDGIAAPGGIPVADLLLAGLLAAAAVAIPIWRRMAPGRAALMGMAAAIGTALYLALLAPVVKVNAILSALQPGGSSLTADGNTLPVNYLVALGVLLLTVSLSAILGIRWLGRTWLLCAAVFYLLWAAMFTTAFTNPGGLFTGIWQGMGYWIAQQEVARGNQPWYYYFLGMTVYELLPLAFGLAGAVWFARRRDAWGMALALWALLSLLAYIIASEKMPWLLVNITVPFILLAGKFLGALVEGLAGDGIGRRAFRRPAWLTRTLAPLLLAPLLLLCGLALLLGLLDGETGFESRHWAALTAAVLIVIAAAYGRPWRHRRRAAALAALGVAALLLGFGGWSAGRAAYTFDDSSIELLAYAQGASDVRETYRTLHQQSQNSPGGRPDTAPNTAGGGGPAALVDYDMWYPLQWYARRDSRNGTLSFRSFEEDAAENFTAPAVAVAAGHAPGYADTPEGYARTGPARTLLWFPEIYRRPGENRQERSIFRELALDFRWFFAELLPNRQSWDNALNYLLFRRTASPWFYSEHYLYLR